MTEFSEKKQKQSKMAITSPFNPFCHLFTPKHELTSPHLYANARFHASLLNLPNGFFGFIRRFDMKRINARAGVGHRLHPGLRRSHHHVRVEVHFVAQVFPNKL